MKKILENLYYIENAKGANVYLIANSNSFDLIDAAMFKETDKLVEQIESDGFHIKNLRMIILTHCHCDHIGGVAELVRLTGAKVAAHGHDIPFMLQEEVIAGTYHNMMVQEQAFMKQFNCVIQKVDLALFNDDAIDTLGGLKVIHVPGHTPGSIALYQPERRIMFFGDVARNKKTRGLVIGVPEKFNFDTGRTIKDYQKLLKYPIDYALFGHGEPILENTKQLLIAARTPEEVQLSKKSKKSQEQHQD